MATKSEDETEIKPKRVPNWWKIAFFLLLFVFEVTREIAVIASYSEAKPNAFFHLFTYGGYTAAEGSWKRLDGGGKLMPTAVKIECNRDHGQCLEAYSNANDGFFYPPNIDRFDARFTPDLITYENSAPDCATYIVRVDLALKKVLAVRTRKPNPTNEQCKMLEERIEMQLADSYEYSDPGEGHFLPVLNTIGAIFKALDKK